MNYFTKPYLSAICFLLLSLMLTFQTEVTANTADELRNTLFRPNTTSVTVTCQVTLNSGESPEGTFITLTGVNNPALYFEGVAPESGTVVFTGVTEANYRLNAVLEGYYELDILITILSNRLIPVNLQEITHNPSNLTLDSVSLRAYWQPVPLQNRHRVSGQPYVKPMGNKSLAMGSPKGGAVSVNRSFTGYAVFLDGILQGNTFDTSFVFEPLVYGQSYLAGVAAVYTSGYSEVDTCRFTSGFLFPTQNLTAETLPLVDYSFLTWEAPEDPQYPGQAVPGLTAYRIYRNQELIAEIVSDTTEFYDLNLPPARYSYEISAVYDLSSYGFPSQTGESMKTGPVEVHIIYGYELPFTENFNAGLFETNQWTVEGTNWRIAGQAGNPAPAVEFYFFPVQMDYSFSLTSFYVIGLDIVDGKIMLDFDLKHTLVNATEEEKLAVEVFNGSQWFKVAEYKNTTGLYWVNKSIDITEQAKNKVFRVRFNAKGVNTLDIFNWLIDNIHVYRVCEPVSNLSADIYLPNLDQIILIWEAPGGSSSVAGWLVWDNGENKDAIGLQGGGVFYAAVRFTPAQLAQYAGTSLTKIRMFPFGPNGSLILKVWTGSNAGSLVLSQAVATYTPGEWNEFTLNTPVAVTGYEELWFGYEVTHTSNDYVAGCDKGPALAGFGDMISLDGSVWESMATQYGLNYNWNLRGYVETIDGATAALQPVKDETVYGNNTALAAGNYPALPTASPSVEETSNSRELVVYNIYRDGEMIATTTETTYLDNDDILEFYETYCYIVVAVYEDCEAPGELVCIIPEKTNNVNDNNVNVYPNPSNSVVNIEVSSNISQVVIYNYVGQVVLENNVNGAQTLKVDVRNYEAGAYLVKFITKEGESIIKKVVVTK